MLYVPRCCLQVSLLVYCNDWSWGVINWVGRTPAYCSVGHGFKINGCHFLSSGKTCNSHCLGLRSSTNILVSLVMYVSWCPIISSRWVSSGNSSFLPQLSGKQFKTLRLDMARIKRPRVHREQEINCCKSLNWFKSAVSLESPQFNPFLLEAFVKFSPKSTQVFRYATH